jgi:hypothetical protein
LALKPPAGPYKPRVASPPPLLIDRRRDREDNGIGPPLRFPRGVPTLFLPGSPRMLRFVAAIACCFVTSVPALAQPAISAISPGAVVSGQTTEITLSGPNLADPLAVWTSFPAKVEVAPGEPTSRKLSITLEEGVPAGVWGIVVGNAGGVTPAVRIMVDDLTSVAEAVDNHSLATAQALSVPAAVDGVADGQQFDYFRVTLAEGERLALEVVAARLGSDLDPVIRVLDAGGRELASADDDEGLGADPRLAFIAPTAGDYVVELRDNRYKAGGRYRLRLGDFPLAAATAPQSGEPSPTIEPAEGASEPIAVNLPAAMFGRLLQPKERDVYKFTATKGERWNFQATSRSFGSPAVIAMRVLNAAGGVVAASTPSEAEEEMLSITGPDDGEYQLEVADLLGRGGDSYSYRIEATSGPLFSLVAKVDPATKFQHLLAPGGAFTFDVQVQRNGYDGPVALSFDAGRQGFRLLPDTIPAGVNEIRVYVTPPADFSAGELVALRLVGTANVGPREHRSVASNVAQLRAAHPLDPYPPQWLAGSIFVGHAEQAPFFTVVPAASELTIAPGSEATASFTFERTDENFKEVPLTLMLSGLPAGITHEVKREGNGPQETYQVVFKATPEAAEGKHSITWRGYAEHAGRGRMIDGELQLNVAKPAEAAE